MRATISLPNPVCPGSEMLVEYERVSSKKVTVVCALDSVTCQAVSLYGAALLMTEKVIRECVCMENANVVAMRAAAAREAKKAKKLAALLH